MSNTNKAQKRKGGIKIKQNNKKKKKNKYNEKKY